MRDSLTRYWMLPFADWVGHAVPRVFILLRCNDSMGIRRCTVEQSLNVVCNVSCMLFCAMGSFRQGYMVDSEEWAMG